MLILRFVVMVPALLAGCASTRAPVSSRADTPGSLTCVLQPLGNSGVGGSLTFSQVAEGVLVQGQVTGLPPNSTHGFHIHEKGDCSAPDGSSAGGHFNPEGHGHGGADAVPSHVGDLGNIAADAQGVATVRVVKRGATLSAGPNAVVGRGVIVHANADDFTTQPTGAAGGRIACGVIEAR